MNWIGRQKLVVSTVMDGRHCRSWRNGLILLCVFELEFIVLRYIDTPKHYRLALV